MSENLDSSVSEKMRHLNVEINSRVTRLEELGQKGEVEEAQGLLKEVEALERERERNRTAKIKEGTKVSTESTAVLNVALFVLQESLRNSNDTHKCSTLTRLLSCCPSLLRLWLDLRWMPMISMRRWSCVMCVAPSWSSETHSHVLTHTCLVNSTWGMLAFEQP